MTPGRATVLLLAAAISAVVVSLACTPVNVRSIEPEPEVVRVLTISVAD